MFKARKYIYSIFMAQLAAVVAFAAAVAADLLS